MLHAFIEQQAFILSQVMTLLLAVMKQAKVAAVQRKLTQIMPPHCKHDIRQSLNLCERTEANLCESTEAYLSEEVVWTA